MIRRFALALLAPLLLAQPAQAAELWTMFDTRVALSEDIPGAPRYMRFFNQYRLGPDYAWFGQALLRMGPVWEPHPNWVVAAHVTNSLEQQGDRSYRQEFRLEFEPTLQGQWGAWGLGDRSRFERSFFGDGTARWRYRNQLRVSYGPQDWPCRLSLSDEIFWIVDRGLSENRLALVAAIPTADTDRLDVGYTLRARAGTSEWDLSHVLTVTFVFGPEREPLFTGPAAD